MNGLTVSWRLVLLILVAAMPVFILHIWTALESRSNTLAVAEDQLMRSAGLLAAQEDQLFLNGRNILSTILVVADEIGISEPDCDLLLGRIVAENESYTAMGVATAGGTIQCGADPDVINESVNVEALLADAAATRSLVVGQPANGFLPIALASRGLSGDIQYFGVALLDLEHLTADMALARLPAEGIGMIFDANQNVIAKVPASSSVDQTVFNGVGPQVTASSGGTGLVETTTVEGGRQLWAVADFLPEQGLFVAIGIDIAAVVGDAEQALWRGIAILLSLFAAAAVTAWAIGQQTIRRPLERLATSASALRAGDFSVEVKPASSAKEIRELELDFNQMATALRDRETELQQHNARLNELIAEKEMLVREMNHRIKNSLQLVSSVVGLQLGTVADPVAQGRLRDAQGRISAIAKVHERLYVGAKLDSVEVGPFLKDLCAELARTLGLDDQRLSVNVAKCDLPPDRAIPLGMITSELVTNAIKHAVRGEEGQIEVNFEMIGDGARFSVTDSGPGFPADYDEAKPSGLGLKVVNALARQLGSELKVERLKTGTRFSIEVPLTER